MAVISSIRDLNNTRQDIRAQAIPFGQVDSTSTSTAFTATVAGITSLYDGVCVYLKNGVVTSASGFTLNINNLGALPVYSTLSAASRATTLFNVSYTMLFVYNSSRVEGGCWDCFYGYDSNTNTIGYQLRTNSMSLPVSKATYRYRILFTSPDGEKFIPSNNSTSTNATSSRTVNDEKIDPFGRIVYYNYTSAVSAGSCIGASYIMDQMTIVLGYSFNRTGAALTLTSWKPVYIKCAPQTDGSAIIDANNPYVQDLPTTEDNKIYIFLGVAYDATHIELLINHPVYWYKDGHIRQWTNAVSGTSGSSVSVSQTLTSGTEIAGITVDNVETKLYAPTPPTKVSDLTNDSGFITGYTETDPTVPAWAKAANKPSYTASEVGALPDSTTIPSKTSDLTNDSGFITGYTETDPTVPSWAKQANKPTYTATEVGALPASTSIPSATSDLTNDSGFITSGDVPAALLSSQAELFAFTQSNGVVTPVYTKTFQEMYVYYASNKKVNCFEILETYQGEPVKVRPFTIVNVDAVNQTILMTAVEGKDVYKVTLTCNGQGTITGGTEVIVGLSAVLFTRTLSSGTQIGTITINGTSTTIYAPTAYVPFVVEFDLDNDQCDTTYSSFEAALTDQRPIPITVRAILNQDEVYLTSNIYKDYGQGQDIIITFMRGLDYFKLTYTSNGTINYTGWESLTNADTTSY